MFALAILIGIYSYFVFALGLMGLLFKPIIIAVTILFIFFVTVAHRGQAKIHKPFLLVRSLLREGDSLGKLEKLFLGVIILLAFVNLIGALGPELGFDALWYHLTLPKLYLENHSIFYIPGGLLYYSLLPKLTEMLYVGALAMNGEILAKLIHFAFGLLSSIALYKLSRNFFTPKISLIAVVVFYSNLVVGWQSTTAYVDLARTFFEIMALWGFVNFWKRGEKKWLIESAVMLGLAISTKLLALGSLMVFTVLIVIHYFTSEESKFKGPPRRSPFGHLRGVVNTLFVYWVICLLIPLPWFVFSYINTGNPIYPFFTDIYKVGFNVELLNPIKFIGDIWGMFMELSDPISPIYIILLPFILVLFKKLKPEIKLIAFYCFLSIVIWYLTPRTGGGRFILPYLPAFSIVAAAVIEKLGAPRRSPSGHLRGVARRLLGGDLRSVLISIIIIVSIISILYRGIANSKYIPVIVGTQTKSEFLAKNLNFSFGDFYDTDNYFKKHIKHSDKVLLYGFHNLYYVEFPFIDSSWVKKGDSFNYIATQGAPSADGLPKKYRDWDLVYQNQKTHINLYSKGGIKWSY